MKLMCVQAAAKIQAMMRSSWRKQGKSRYKSTAQQLAERQAQPKYDVNRFYAAGKCRDAPARRPIVPQPDVAASKIQRFLRNSLKLRVASRNRSRPKPQDLRDLEPDD